MPEDILEICIPGSNWKPVTVELECQWHKIPFEDREEEFYPYMDTLKYFYWEGLGGTMIIWTKEKCIEASKNCKTRKEFIVKYPGAYRSSKKNNWLNDIYNNFSQLVNEKGFWTKEKCYNESLKFKTRKELKENCLACYSTIINNKWCKELFAHMEHYSGLKLKGYWNKENCLEASKRYKTKTSFRENEAGAYKASKKNGWLEEFFK
jgi:hypothetical protein